MIDLSNRKVAICFPSPEKIDYRFQGAWFELIRASSSLVLLSTVNVVSSRIAVNRNEIVAKARATGATDILWIDADSKFPPDALLRLLKHDKDIVAATTCWRKFSDRSPIVVPLETSSDQVNQKLIKVRQIGMPFMLTKMKVFDRLDELGLAPDQSYFAEPPRWMMKKSGWESDGIDALVAEDEYFCRLVRMAGFDIFCDMELTLEIGHIGSTVFYVENIAKQEAKVDEVLC